MHEAAQTTETDAPAPDEPKGRWCLVANVTKEYANANRPAGSRHLPEGAKLYVDGVFNGDGWYSAKVLSKDRRNHLWFLTYIRVHWLHNFRAVMEYSPAMRKRLDAEHFLGGYDDEAEKDCSEYATTGNQRAVNWETERIARRHTPPTNEPGTINSE